MDNWYTSPFIIHNLLQVDTGACGTCKQNRRGLPNNFSQIKLKQGERVEFTYDKEITLLKIFDRKPVTLISSVYSSQNIDVGRKHWKTKEVVTKPALMHFYNKYMGGVDCNDQLLQYSAFNRRSLKWWVKVAFRLFNLAMINAFILYNEWRKLNSMQIITQYNFRLNVVKQLLHSVTTKQKSRHVSPLAADVLHLSDKHFLGKIPVPAGKKKATRNCVVCNPGERKMYKNKNIKLPNRPGSESIYFCKQCDVALCVVPCFELYHSHQDYILKYIEMMV